MGQQMQVVRSHHLLHFLQKFKFKNQKLTQWSLLLEECNLVIKHIRTLKCDGKLLIASEDGNVNGNGSDFRCVTFFSLFTLYGPGIVMI